MVDVLSLPDGSQRTLPLERDFMVETTVGGPSVNAIKVTTRGQDLMFLPRLAASGRSAVPGRGFAR